MGEEEPMTCVLNVRCCARKEIWVYHFTRAASLLLFLMSFGAYWVYLCILETMPLAPSYWCEALGPLFYFELFGPLFGAP